LSGKEKETHTGNYRSSGEKSEDFRRTEKGEKALDEGRFGGWGKRRECIDQ